MLVVKITYICYHFSPSLVPLPVVGPLLFLLQHTLSGCAIFQSKLAQDFAESMNADVSHSVYGMAQEQQEGMEPANVKYITSLVRYLQMAEAKFLHLHLLLTNTPKGHPAAPWGSH